MHLWGGLVPLLVGRRRADAAHGGGEGNDGGRWGRLLRRRKDVSRICAGVHTICLPSLELLQHRWIYIQCPIQIVAHLPVHLVDFTQLKHSLRDDRPQLVRIGIVPYDFAG